MNGEEFKAIAFSIIILTAAIVAYPILVESRREVEPFSELAILGRNMKIGDYPQEIAVNQTFNLYIYIGNHMGESQYFRVLTKFGDTNSTVSDVTASNAPVLTSWDCILLHETNKTLPITISIPVVGLQQRLIFELYRYDSVSDSFLYDQRWIQLWINVYGSGT